MMKVQKAETKRKADEKKAAAAKQKTDDTARKENRGSGNGVGASKRKKTL